MGRGVKRKWSCLEELEAVSLPAAAEKKSGEEDLGDEDGFLVGPSIPDVNRTQQRQLLAGLCLEKLQHYQVGVELSLRRSVLLINTLRQIQEDMQLDGMGTCASPGGINPVTCPRCAGDSPSSPGSISLGGTGSHDQQKAPPAGGVGAFCDAVTPMGYLSDLTLDDIFEDIDTSMYETSDLPSVWAGGSLWPISVSLWTNEDVKMRSPGHASAESLKSCLVDMNELDHIMEILVES